MSIISKLKMSDIYSQKLAEADELDLRMESETDLNQRQIYQNWAWMRGMEATWIAHCIALFGDLPVSAAVALLEDHDSTAKTRLCCGQNPWIRGLKLLSSFSDHSTVSHPQKPQS